ncbi:metal-dependent hydrolase [Paracoccaceae bacterium GXU_MW_L88]
MLIAHLPVGYITATAAARLGARSLFYGLLAGSVLPDIDMLWFHFVDQGAVHHHEYLTHRPVLWLLVGMIGLLFKRHLLIGLGIGGLLHMVLDSIAGAIAWRWPLSEATTTLVTIPATHDNWVMSFLFHWTFLSEIALLLIALLILVFRWRSA